MTSESLQPKVRDSPSGGDADAVERMLRALSIAHGARIVKVLQRPGRAPRYGEWPAGLNEGVVRGLPRPYSHQAQAVERALAGENVVVATATNSGKSLCYTVPILHNLATEPEGRALLLYPLKALAQDQHGKLVSALDRIGAAETDVAKYDRSLSDEKRLEIKRQLRPRVVLSNPDQLHHMLREHAEWKWLFANLRYLVLDELHVYKGVFGSHVANVIRRLRRVASAYGAQPRFIATSATIGNPDELASRLCGVPFAAVADDGSASADKHYVILDATRGTPKLSVGHLSTDIFATMVRNGIKTIDFTRTRRATKLVFRDAVSALEKAAPSVSRRIGEYTAQHTAQQRGAIEARLASDDLRGVVSTNALELGIDIGSLDGCIITAYPGSISSFRQQAGRAGRSNRRGLVIFIADTDPLNQHFAEEPDRLVDGMAEVVGIEPDNPTIARQHVLCALRELPRGPNGEAWFGSSWELTLAALERDGLIRRTPYGVSFPQAVSAHYDVKIRNASAERYQVIDERGREIAISEVPRVFAELHEGALFLHEGETYRVQQLDLRARKAVVRTEDTEHTTQAIADRTVTLVEPLLSPIVTEQYTAAYGVIVATERVVGYCEMKGDVRVGKLQELTLPTTTLRTRGIRLTLSRQVLDAIKATGREVRPAAHALEHLLTSLLPIDVSCDPTDVAGASLSSSNEDEAVIYIYDRVQDGAGLTERAYGSLPGLLAYALERANRCPCRSGCPRCVHSARCESRNDHLSKLGVRGALAAILSRPPPSAPGQDAPANDNQADAVTAAVKNPVRKSGRPGPSEEQPQPGLGPTKLWPGRRVSHERFGPGVVVRVKDEPNGPQAIIDFERVGRKKLNLLKNALSGI